MVSPLGLSSSSSSLSCARSLLPPPRSPAFFYPNLEARTKPRSSYANTTDSLNSRKKPVREKCEGGEIHEPQEVGNNKVRPCRYVLLAYGLQRGSRPRRHHACAVCWNSLLLMNGRGSLMKATRTLYAQKERRWSWYKFEFSVILCG